MNLLAATTFSDSDGMIAGAATGFRPLDWMVVALFLLWMLWIGFRTGRRNPARPRIMCWAAER